MQVEVAGWAIGIYTVSIAISYNYSYNMSIVCRTQNTSLRITGTVPGSGVLTHNFSYELTKISRKQTLPFETERNPAYATLSDNPGVQL